VKPPEGAWHLLSHAPQWDGSFWVFTQLLPHFANPALHSKSQLPFLHVGEPWGSPAHATPQLPQFVGLVLVSTHCPPHAVVPVGHWAVHEPETQNSPVAHSLAQSPQWCGSDARSMQACVPPQVT
jgi:hypothetical protein